MGGKATLTENITKRNKPNFLRSHYHSLTNGPDRLLTKHQAYLGVGVEEVAYQFEYTERSNKNSLCVYI